MPPCAAEKAAGAGCGCRQPAAAVAALKRAGTARPKPCSTTAWCPARRCRPACKGAWTKPSPSCPSPGDELPARNRLRHGQLLPGWTSVNFVRPAHGPSGAALAATVGAREGRWASRLATARKATALKQPVSPVVLQDADSYAATAAKDGAVIASFAERKAEICPPSRPAADKRHAPAHRRRSLLDRSDRAGRAPQRRHLPV